MGEAAMTEFEQQIIQCNQIDWSALANPETYTLHTDRKPNVRLNKSQKHEVYLEYISTDITHAELGIKYGVGASAIASYIALYKPKRPRDTARVAGVKIKPSGSYQAVIHINGKVSYIGTFPQEWDAICARKSAELKLK
jgi:hypothetical protein